jgi:hypothetical protein
MVREKKEIYYMTWDMPWGRIKISTQFAFSHLLGKYMSYKFK